MRATTWSIKGRTLDLSCPLIMGILNVTPDSFSDGGTHNTLDQALSWARRMREEGADIIDVGGESTRPGAADVAVQDEIDRVIPVVEALVKEGFIVSVDTSKPEVMRQSLQVGAHIINDIRAFQEEGAIEAIQGTDAGLIIMHMQGAPRTMQVAPHYEDLLGEVAAFLRDREAALVKAGIATEQICWDPGFGFGKTVKQNFALLKATSWFVDQGRPYLMGLSRKSSIGAVTGIQDASKRVVGSVAGHLLAVDRGAQIVRVHDVAATREALDVWQAMQ